VPANYLSIEFSGTKTGAIQYLSQLTGYLPVYYNKTNGGPKVVFVDVDDIGSYTPSGVTVVGKGATVETTFGGIRVLGELNTYPKTPGQFQGEYSGFSNTFEIAPPKEVWEIAYLQPVRILNEGDWYSPNYKVWFEMIVWFYVRAVEWFLSDPTGLSGTITVGSTDIPIDFRQTYENIQFTTWDPDDVDDVAYEAFGVLGGSQRIDVGLHIMKAVYLPNDSYASRLGAYGVSVIRRMLENTSIAITVSGNNYRIRWPYEIKKGSPPFYTLVNNDVASISQARRYADTFLWMLKGARSYTLFNTIVRTGAGNGVTRSEVEWTPSTGLMCTITTR